MVIKRVTYLGVLLATAAVLTAGTRAEAGTKKRSLRIVLVDVDKVLQEYKKGNDLYEQIREALEPQLKSLRQKAQTIGSDLHGAATRTAVAARLATAARLLRRRGVSVGLGHLLHHLKTSGGNAGSD